MTDKEQIQHLIDKNNKLEADELITFKTKAKDWIIELEKTKSDLITRNTELASYKQTKIDWELKKKIILFLQKTQSVEAYDVMTPNQIAHRAAQFIENILNSKLPPKLAIPLELQVTTREPD